MRLRSTLSLLVATVALAPAAANAQWTNRYPKNVGYGHQVYLEGYELPILANGPGDPAPSPDGKSLAVASRGWIWQLDLESGVARRITRGAGVDSRPAWSPDGRSLVFVRDDSRTTAVVVRNLESGTEREIARGMALDPAFMPDGKAIVYANLQQGGDLDLWKTDLETGTHTRLTQEPGLELRPLPFPDGNRLLFLSKTRGGVDQIRILTLGDPNASTVLLSGNQLTQLRPSLRYSGAEVAYNWPTEDGYELRVSGIQQPAASMRLLGGPRSRMLTPAYSADGAWIYYTEADANQQLKLYRVNRNGGSPTELNIRAWDLDGPSWGRLIVHTGGPARLNARDAQGHPLVPASGMVRFDGQNGLSYFYTNGTIELDAPAGPVTITAVRGLASVPVIASTEVVAGAVRELTVEPTLLWDAGANGWYAGDHHFHLNYGGQFDLSPGDLNVPMRAEGLDVGTPMLANLHNRFENQTHFIFQATNARPILAFGQEVRAHFLGHVGLIGTNELFWPWVWGPGYEVRTHDDRTNAEALAFGRGRGGLGIYVHPISRPDAFSDQGISAIPPQLIADALTGAFDLLEVVCLWSSEIGGAEILYRLLNAGLTIMPSGGTDAMTDLHRTMALGATRVYVRTDGPFSWTAYLAGLKQGRSFVTTGPMVDFRIGGEQPGGVVAAGGREVPFTLTVASALPTDSISIVVNGRTVWSAPGSASPVTTTHRGTLRLPAGGWVGARVVGPVVDRWPAMAPKVFAHTAPVWIGRRGSTEPHALAAAVADLRRALENAEGRVATGYGEAPIPQLRGHFAAARARLDSIATRR